MNLVLSVVKNRTWRDLDCYAISLARSGYTGRKVMFVEDVPSDAQDNLRALGFELIPFTTPSVYNGLHFQTVRYNLAAAYLDLHWTEFEYVIWTDVCDLVFQSNPDEWLARNKGSAKIYTAKEGWLIKNQDINDVWIRSLASGDEYNRIREQEVLCSGSIFGESQQMSLLMQDMWGRCKYAGSMQGIDQGVLNVLMGQPYWKEISRSSEPEEGLVATCGVFLAESDPNVWTIKPPVFDRETGLVRTESGTPFVAMHQYNRCFGPLNRDGSWRSILESRYRN